MKNYFTTVLHAVEELKVWNDQETLFGSQFKTYLDMISKSSIAERSTSLVLLWEDISKELETV